MGSFGQERRKRICLRLQMEDLWIFGVTRSIRSTVSGIQRNLFGTGMEDHHNVADLFQMVRTHGKWGCGNMVPPCYHLVPLSSARFCLL